MCHSGRKSMRSRFPLWLRRWPGASADARPSHGCVGICWRFLRRYSIKQNNESSLCAPDMPRTKNSKFSQRSSRESQQHSSGETVGVLTCKKKTFDFAQGVSIWSWKRKSLGDPSRSCSLVLSPRLVQFRRVATAPHGLRKVRTGGVVWAGGLRSVVLYH